MSILVYISLVNAKNEVVERKNQSFQETTRTLVLKHNLPNHPWAEGAYAAYHIFNRCFIHNNKPMHIKFEESNHPSMSLSNDEEWVRDIQSRENAHKTSEPT